MSLRNPVRYPVKYYSWQDTDAPQLSDIDGVIKTILTACLVTGYGSKQGAGWTATFEDAYRIVLRRPLRTGNPPDIKIENGTITGTTVRHRIIAQNNPTSLDDMNELSAVNLLAHDNSCGQEWHCIVTDFAFLLCYQMGESSGNKKSAMYIGGAKNLQEVDGEQFWAWSSPYITVAGTNGNYAHALLDDDATFTNMRTNSVITKKSYTTINGTEKSINNDFLAQRILLDNKAELPFFTSIFNDINNDNATYLISINNRNMLRYPNMPYVIGYTAKRPLHSHF